MADDAPFIPPLGIFIDTARTQNIQATMVPTSRHNCRRRIRSVIARMPPKDATFFWLKKATSRRLLLMEVVDDASEAVTACGTVGVGVGVASLSAGCRAGIDTIAGSGIVTEVPWIASSYPNSPLFTGKGPASSRGSSVVVALVDGPADVEAISEPATTDCCF